MSVFIEKFYIVLLYTEKLLSLQNIIQLYYNFWFDIL